MSQRKLSVIRALARPDGLAARGFAHIRAYAGTAGSSAGVGERERWR